jgi:hypothetical protein
MKMSDAFLRALHELKMKVDAGHGRQEEKEDNMPQTKAPEPARPNERENYAKFEKLFPQIISGEYSYLRLEAGGGMMPLSIERIFDDRISIMHAYTTNGDLCYDPNVVVEADADARTLKACSFEQSIPPVYQDVYDEGGNADAGMRDDIGEFLSTWLDNIDGQGYMPIRAIMEKDGESTEVLFDDDGNPAAPVMETEPEAEDAYPDPAIGLSERDLYGYSEQDMLPLLQERALELYDSGHTVYLLYSDNTEAVAIARSDIEAHDGIFGMEAGDWAAIRERERASRETVEDEGAREAELLYGHGDRFGIYQLKPDEELRPYRFASMEELEKNGLAPDRDNYALVYSASLNENDTPGSIFERFNIDRPEDFTGHSLSVSDVIVIKRDDSVTSSYTDSYGFAELPGFLGGETSPQQNGQTYSHDGNTPEMASGPTTVAELEARVKVGEQISLSDLADALRREHQEPHRAASKDKPSMLAQLREYQEKTHADEKRRPERGHDNERGI